MTIRERFKRCGIIPVVVLDDAKKATPLAEALLNGGIDICEITFRTEAASEAIKKISSSCPDMLVGAGTILSLEQLDQAYKAGAKFIVSPGYDHEIVKKCKELGLPVFPGAVSPSELMQVIKDGLNLAKFFPAEIFGGLKTIKALAGVFTNIDFMPTGGISPSNLKEYLEFDRILAVGGSWLCDKKLIESSNFEEITRLTKEAKKIHKEIRG